MVVPPFFTPQVLIIFCWKKPMVVGVSPSILGNPHLKIEFVPTLKFNHENYQVIPSLENLSPFKSEALHKGVL